ncbi:hypothetical protein ABEB36_011172 [Hypothenemus hampei]|uniref:Uncharacterized protein n=1 Tax=Hypothenemus hampei TaxID=57062 RepID=A0ABD1EF08_HYPHA
MSSTSTEQLSSSQTRMNSTNLYVTTTQIILNSDPKNPQSWQDLYRLVPYLRNSLCCVVCSSLLLDPLTPTNGFCQHHLCRRCKGGRKRIKPQCESCKDCSDYSSNRGLRILMQLYKKMCSHLMNSSIFKCIKIQASQPGTGFERGASNLIQLIKEGALFEDNYESQGGLPKSTYSILPCIYTNSATAQNIPIPQTSQAESSKTFHSINQSNSPLYSVVYPGSGNKITIKRKSNESTAINQNTNHVQIQEFTEKVVFKKPCAKPKKGCRCGNATATPGKLTCCGQRCPCYVESKACISCKCRGCRNPHRPDGNKVMPFIPELDPSQIVMPPIQDFQLQPMQLLQSPPTSATAPLIEEEPMTGVKINSFPIESQYFSTEPLSSQFKAYKLLGIDIQPIENLVPSPFVSYRLTEDEEESNIMVV